MIRKTIVTGVMAAATTGVIMVSAHAQETAAITGLEQPPITERVQKWNAENFRMLNASVEAFELCRGKLSETAIRGVTNYIETVAGEPLSPGYKLDLLFDAKGDMKRLVITEGCGDDDVKQALALFNQYLLPPAEIAAAASPAPDLVE